MAETRHEGKMTAETGTVDAESAVEAPIENVDRVPDTCAACPRWKEVKSQMQVADVLKVAAENFVNKRQGTDKFVPTVSEYLKLLQIEQEYERELNPPEEIRVRWVEPNTEL